MQLNCPIVFFNSNFGSGIYLFKKKIAVFLRLLVAFCDVVEIHMLIAHICVSLWCTMVRCTPRADDVRSLGNQIRTMGRLSDSVRPTV